MNFEDLAWGTFRKTGDIDAYLLHKDIENTEKKEWTVSKPEELSQKGQTMRKPTVY